MSKSSFLPRLGLSRADGPILPLHTRTSPPIRKKPSEYDLSDLSPRPDDGLLASPEPGTRHSTSSYPTRRRSPSPTPRYRDSSPSWSPEPNPPPPQRILFAGPPPPIAVSQVLYRDEEDRDTSRHHTEQPSASSTSTSTFVRNINSVFFDRAAGARTTTRTRDRDRDYDHDRRPDAVWLDLQRRERALQADLQRLLDAQSAGLVAHLGEEPGGSLTTTATTTTGSSSAAVSEASSDVAGGGSGSASNLDLDLGGRDNGGGQRGRTARGGGSRHVAFSDSPTSTTSSVRTPTHGSTMLHPASTTSAGRRRSAQTRRQTESGTLLPPRQPRSRPLGLRAARAGLSHAMAQLAGLKKEEDAQLSVAVAARRGPLGKLGRLERKRAEILGEMRAFLGEEGEGENGGESEGEDERDDGTRDEGAGSKRWTRSVGGRGGSVDGDGKWGWGAETQWEDQHEQEQESGRSLGRELRALERERDAVAREVAAVEVRLGKLRRRHRFLDSRVEEVRSRREAGLSGYRGALREVEARIAALLSRPGVAPLDSVPFLEGQPREEVVAGGVEFLRLRPERRTADMAREWWEGELAILEKRKVAVNRDRAALEEGVEVWNGAVRLVSEFEAALRREMRGETSDVKGKGKDGEPASPPQSLTPEEAMHAQLDKMSVVMAGLQEHLEVAEDKGWNLLICAIGAELEAFRQAEVMLREALRAAGLGNDAEDDDGQGDSTPHLGRSTSLRDSQQGLDRSAGGASLAKSGNLVDFLKEGHREPESDNEVPPDLLVDTEGAHELESPTLSREDSENEVPIEFLREHPSHAAYGEEGVVA